jgi:hypothetical protein
VTCNIGGTGDVVDVVVELVMVGAAAEVAVVVGGCGVAVGTVEVVTGSGADDEVVGPVSVLLQLPTSTTRTTKTWIHRVVMAGLHHPCSCWWPDGRRGNRLILVSAHRHATPGASVSAS